jgi:peptidoglycan/LPS O-acetylase OafA/YrhL
MWGWANRVAAAIVAAALVGIVVAAIATSRGADDPLASWTPTPVPPPLTGAAWLRLTPAEKLAYVERGMATAVAPGCAVPPADAVAGVDRLVAGPGGVAAQVPDLLAALLVLAGCRSAR